MKKFAAALGFAAILMVGAASADTIGNSVGNTLTVTTPDAMTFRYHFEANGTYTVTGANQTVSGVWVVNGDQICLTPQGQAQQCYPYDGSKNVGDTWTMNAPNGGGVTTLTITAGR